MLAPPPVVALKTIGRPLRHLPEKRIWRTFSPLNSIFQPEEALAPARPALRPLRHSKGTFRHKGVHRGAALKLCSLILRKKMAGYVLYSGSVRQSKIF